LTLNSNLAILVYIPIYQYVPEITMIAIDLKSAKPLYSQVKTAILDYIEENDLNPGSVLPSERELSHLFSISRLTIRKALDHLEQEGTIFRQQGKGAFVGSSKLQQPLLVLTSFTEAVRQEGHTPGTQLLGYEIMENRHSISRKLNLEPGSKVLRISRLRSVDNLPFSLATSYLDAALAENLTQEDLQTQSLYSILQEKHNIILTKTKATLETVAVEHADALLLNIKPGAPVFLMSGVTISKSGKVIEYFKVLYRGDRLKFMTESK
jgi:GntR family transcriptional regulator